MLTKQDILKIYFEIMEQYDIPNGYAKLDDFINNHKVYINSDFSYDMILTIVKVDNYEPLHSYMIYEVKVNFDEIIDRSLLSEVINKDISNTLLQEYYDGISLVDLKSQIPITHLSHLFNSNQKFTISLEYDPTISLTPTIRLVDQLVINDELKY